MSDAPLDRGLRVLARMGLGVWVGAVAAIAFVAAPLVFGAVPEHLADKDAAARVIGPAFARVDVLGLVAGALGLAALLRARRAPGVRLRLALLVLMTACAAVDALVLAPAITAREEPLAAYHGAATVLWMTVLLGGLGLLGAGLLPQDAAESCAAD